MNFGLFGGPKAPQMKLQGQPKGRSSQKLKKRILVLEDDDEIIELFKAMKADRGWNIEFAKTSGEALSLVSRRPFDLLILDWNLPDFNADDFVTLSDSLFTSHTKKSDYSLYHKVPVITFTGECPSRVKIDDSKHFFHFERWKKPMSYSCLEQHVISAMGSEMKETVL